MPITTFLNEHEKLRFIVVSDEEVNEHFQKLREINNKVYLQEVIKYRNRLFRKPIIEKVYCLYFDYLAPESNWDIQIINLGNLGGFVSKEVVMAYLIGFINGNEDRALTHKGG